MLSRDEILEVYEQGAEAVVTLVQTLVDRQQAQLEVLTARVKELEDRLAVDSHNSSKPPSSDSTPKPRSLRSKSGRKLGGQIGHEGATLRWSEQPECVIVHTPSDCLQCGASLSGAETVGQQRRQVVDLPQLRLVTTEHRAQQKRCRQCGAINLGRLPASAVGTVCYGPGIRGLGV